MKVGETETIKLYIMTIFVVHITALLRWQKGEDFSVWFYVKILAKICIWLTSSYEILLENIRNYKWRIFWNYLLNFFHLRIFSRKIWYGDLSNIFSCSVFEVCNLTSKECHEKGWFEASNRFVLSIAHHHTVWLLILLTLTTKLSNSLVTKIQNVQESKGIESSRSWNSSKVI